MAREEAFGHAQEVDASRDTPKGSSVPPIKAIATTNSIALDWCPSDHKLETIFQVKMKLPTAMEWTLVYYGKATSYTITGLLSGTNAAVHIRVVNPGANQWSSIGVFSTLPTPPEAPTALVATDDGDDEVVLEWHRPLHDGGYLVNGFRLEMRRQPRATSRRAAVVPTEISPEQEPSSVAVTFGNCTRFIAEGLEAGATYCFRVQALNLLGAGPFSEPVVVHRPSLPPNVPEPPVVLDKTYKSASLSWLPPLCNGAPIESFTLQVLFVGYGERSLPIFIEGVSATNLDLQDALLSGKSEDDPERGMVFEESVDSPGLALHDVYCGPSNEFSVRKLCPFSTYAFRVQAENAAGTSGFSAFSICLTPAAAPHPPPPPTVVEADSSSLTLNWDIPELDNGSPVFRYTLETLKVEINTRSLETGKKRLRKPAQVTSSRVWVVVYEGPDLWSRVSDLAPGNEYSFRVKARNTLGASAPSSTLVASTLPTAPCAPLPPSFSRVTPTSVQIKWASPEGDNGMPVTSYKLMLDDGQGGPFQNVYEGEARSFRASKLLVASTYRAAVQAINARGASAMSEAAVVVLPAELPSPPPIAPASSSTAGDGLPLTTIRQASPDSAVLEVVARKKTKPAPEAVEVTATRKARAVPATGKQPAAAESIKSIREVKQLMKKKRQGWPQKVARALIQACWHVQQEWPVLALILFVFGGVYIFVKLLPEE